MATTILAVLFFHEAVGKRIAVALGLITISCIILSYDPAAVWGGFSLAALGILLTCTCWSLDNNISRNVAAKDPIPIVAIKGGVVAGVLMAGGVAFLLGETVPSLSVAVIAMVVGFFSYGGALSVCCFCGHYGGVSARRVQGRFLRSLRFSA
ncbi:hypothetical protein [Methanogenium cariaci]|uniref:hypothetical protein n=1 Tax=Methanogenium cariaci TaxID=2197 RepID=UPI001FE11029|nr:hypothetical protein [Methanogenium cariaci]